MKLLYVFIFLTFSALAADPYLVRRKDTLSEIAQDAFPESRLYGSRGKVAELIRLNPHLKNPNRIYPQEVVWLRDPSKSTAANAPIPVFEVKPMRDIGQSCGRDEWNVSATYGAKFVSVSQSGGLGNFDFGILFLNDFKLQSEFILEDWSAWLQLDSYRFRYEASSQSDDERMNSLVLGGSYKWMLFAVGAGQNPIFLNEGGSVQMARVTTTSVSLGGKKDIELPSAKPTWLKVKAWMSLPLSSSTDDPAVKASSISGYGLRGQLELTRRLVYRPYYDLWVFWMSNFGQQRFSQSVEWGTSSGRVGSDVVDASSSLGLVLKF